MSKELRVPAEVFDRCCGYFRPVYINGKSGQWNPAKTEEHRERKRTSLEQIHQYVKEEALI